MTDSPKPDRRRQSLELQRQLAAASRETNRPADSTPVVPSQFVQLPATFGRYQVEKLLGRGAMGSVYLARDTQLNRRVALKIPKVAASGSKRLLQRLQTEAQAAAQLDHPCLCKVYDAGEVNGQCFIAMQFIEGETLKSQLERHNKSIPESVSLILQLAEGLSEAHDLGIIHRDLKPENIMLNRRGVPVIMDFGLAKFSTLTGNAAATQAGTILGSPAYMSPEQASGNTQEIDQRSDIYALGTILFEMLTGEWPFNGSAMQILGQKSLLEPTSPLTIRPDLPPRLAHICSRMIAKECVDRYQTLAEVITDLRQFQETQSEPRQSTPSHFAFEPQELAEVAAEQSLPPFMKARRRKLAASKSQPAPLTVMQRCLAGWAGCPPIWKWAAIGTGGTAAALVLLFGGLLLFPTRNGVLQINIDDPTVTVRVNGSSFDIDDNGRQIRVTPTDRQTLEVLRDGIVIESATQELVVKRGEKRVFSVQRIGAELLVDGKPIATTNQPAAGSAAPAIAAVPFPVSAPAAPARAAAVPDSWFGWPSDAPPPAMFPFDAERARSHQQAWATFLKVPVECSNSLGMKFRLIPPGEFIMGATPAAIEQMLTRITPGDQAWQDFVKSSGPQHTVILTRPVYVGEHEVTQGEYAAVVGANPSAFAASGSQRDAVTDMDTTHFPVDNVSWNDAVEFCVKLTAKETSNGTGNNSAGIARPAGTARYALPTEAQWAFACRAGTTSRLWTGDDEDCFRRAGWFGINSGNRPHVVGEHSGNPFGLFDVHGNLSEWCSDAWELSYYASFNKAPAIDPAGPQGDLPLRAIRGGAFDDSQVPPTASDRYAFPPATRKDSVGFRITLSVEAVKAAIAGQETWLVVTPPALEVPSTATTPSADSTKPSANSAPTATTVRTELVKRPRLRAVYPPSRLQLVQQRPFDQNVPFKELNLPYEAEGVLGIRCHGGVYGWNVWDLPANQILRAKVRVRQNQSGRVGLCLTQKGDQRGALIWITGDQKVILTPSMFAREKPQFLERTYYLPDVVQPLENWNDLTCVLRNNALAIYLNETHIDTVNLKTYPIAPATVAFSVWSQEKDTVVEMDEYSVYAIK